VRGAIGLGRGDAGGNLGWANYRDAVYDLKAVNPHTKAKIDSRTPEEILDIIEANGREIAEAIALLREKAGGK
jgi:hypothetical protein